jgi:hypothetical protein
MTNVTPEADKERAWVEDQQCHHHRGEVINATTPSSCELPRSIMTSGIASHEHVEPEYNVEIPRPTEPATLKLVPFASVQLGLLTALLGLLTASMAIKVTRVVGTDRAPAAAVS